MTEEVKTLFQIPECNFPALEEKLEKLNKTAAKLNCNPITYDVIKEEIKKVENQYIKFFHVEIIGNSPIISGWEFLGKIQHESAGNILRILPGNENINLNKYRFIAPICDHCKQNRKRKDTYLIKHENTGEIKQIGKSCLKDFLCHTSPQQIASYLEIILNMEEFLQEYQDFSHMPRDEYYLPLELYLSIVAETILRFGWLSKSKIQELYSEGFDGPLFATSDRAFFNYNLNIFPKINNKPEFKFEEITEKSKELAQKAIHWARNEMEAKNDYFHNLKIIVAGDKIKIKNIGFAASLIPTYQREKELKAKSNFYGNIKDKIEKELTLQKVFTFETDFGLCHIYKFVDVEGNIFIWKTSKYIKNEEGETIKIKGTIKDHNEYKGENQTILTRCKII